MCFLLNNYCTTELTKNTFTFLFPRNFIQAFKALVVNVSLVLVQLLG